MASNNDDYGFEETPEKFTKVPGSSRLYVAHDNTIWEATENDYKQVGDLNEGDYKVNDELTLSKEDDVAYIESAEDEKQFELDDYVSNEPNEQEVEPSQEPYGPNEPSLTSQEAEKVVEKLREKYEQQDQGYDREEVAEELRNVLEDFHGEEDEGEDEEESAGYRLDSLDDLMKLNNALKQAGWEQFTGVTTFAYFVNTRRAQKEERRKAEREAGGAEYSEEGGGGESGGLFSSARSTLGDYKNSLLGGSDESSEEQESTEERTEMDDYEDIDPSSEDEDSLASTLMGSEYMIVNRDEDEGYIVADAEGNKYRVKSGEDEDEEGIEIEDLSGENSGNALQLNDLLKERGYTGRDLKDLAEAEVMPEDLEYTEEESSGGLLGSLTKGIRSYLPGGGSEEYEEVGVTQEQHETAEDIDREYVGGDADVDQIRERLDENDIRDISDEEFREMGSDGGNERRGIWNYGERVTEEVEESSGGGDGGDTSDEGTLFDEAAGSEMSKDSDDLIEEE